jgi:hypothetical protein
MSRLRYICSMTLSDQPPARPQRGRPRKPVPNGRDLDAELTILETWLNERPALKPATISKAAGLKAPTLGDMLRKVRRPQADTLDKIHSALVPYGYKNS